MRGGPCAFLLQGRISMHEPEHWGLLQFAEGAVNATAPAFDEARPATGRGGTQTPGSL